MNGKRFVLSPEVRGLEAEAIRLRRDFHAHPELGYQEQRTSAAVAKHLRASGLQVRTGVARTGVVGLLRGTRPGPTVMWRADMDALPIVEANDVPYKSTNPGVMHACGHDGHTAIALTLARRLAAERSTLAGTVKFVFQPAEEGPGGAEPMIAAGVLERPKVDCALGLHLWNNFPVGKIGAPGGPLLASADKFELTIRGKGGHGAMPHLAVDPIVVAAQMVTAFQTIVSRNVNPLESAVVSVCQIQGGEAHNVLPESVKMVGTLRAFRADVRRHIERRVREIATSVAKAGGARVQFDFFPGYPPTINNAEVAAQLRTVAAEVVGADRVTSEGQTLGGEDMSYFLERVPGCYFFLGSANEKRGLHYSHHHPRFDFDEAALAIGVEIGARMIRQVLSRGG